MSASADRPAVRAKALEKRYGPKRVLAGIDIEIEAGTRFCLVGANGSGKSTLLEMIMGLRARTSGRLEVLGLDPLDPRLKGRRAMLLDRASFPYFAKVGEVVWMYSGFLSRTASQDRLLADLELDAGAYVRHLSKGQRQRLGLLLSLLGEPELILLDEPTSGLDPQARLHLWELLHRRLERQPELTLVFASHDLAEAERWGERIAVVHRGRLLEVDTPERLCAAAVGARRKVTVVGGDLDAASMLGDGVSAVGRMGAELALYTDCPAKVLERLEVGNGVRQVRIEDVGLADAYFKLTGELLNHEHARPH